MVLDLTAILEILKQLPPGKLVVGKEYSRCRLRIAMGTYLQIKMMGEKISDSDFEARFADFIEQLRVKIKPATFRQVELAQLAEHQGSAENQYKVTRAVQDSSAYALAIELADRLVSAEIGGDPNDCIRCLAQRKSPRDCPVH